MDTPRKKSPLTQFSDLYASQPISAVGPLIGELYIYETREERRRYATNCHIDYIDTIEILSPTSNEFGA